MRYFLLTMWALFSVSAANYPVFEAANQLKRLLIPADVHIGSVIYRLRASDHDHDYPLLFDATDYGSYVVRVENLPCTTNSTYCEANVFLDRVLVAGQTFKFRFTVRDTKGDTTTAPASVEVTNAPVDITTIFPHMPGIIVIPEDTKVGTELEYVIVRRHPEHKKATLLEIRGSSVMDFGRTRTAQETITGVITLMKSVDFEQQNMYKLQIFALDMYTDKLVDSRNIAGFDLLLIIQDVQDTPPIFLQIEPTIKLRSNLTQGDIITKIVAVDGDRGNPRQIKYGLVSESNPFTIFFSIDRITGDLMLAKPLKQLIAITRSHQPILLTILAEEEIINTKEPTPMSATATIALLLAEAGNTPPYFDNDHYVCYLNENSPQGTALVFSDAYNTQVHDDDMGKQGVFSLQLEQNNGTFEISPNVVERKAYFTIRVRNKLLLDYETRPSVQFVIVARELDPGSLSSTASVLVYLNDINDNPPQFQKILYMSQIPENATANALVAEVKATDVDTGLAGSVHYTRITGYRNSSLMLNSVTGVITLATDNHGFDREEASEYQMTVEARDMEGTGLLATVPLIIRILDVNDETPVFENAPFHFTLTSDMRNFSNRAFIKATDKDAESPNNVVRYEIISGNYNNKFILNAETGELMVRHSEVSNHLRKRRQTLSSVSSNVYSLTVRAYDLGVPHRWSTAQVRIFPPDTGTRLLNFLIPAKAFDYGKMEELLMKMSGGQITIIEINPYRPHRYTRAVTETTRKLPLQDKSMVVARVTYGDNTIIDIEQIYYLLQTVFSVETLPRDEIELRTANTGVGLYWIIIILILLFIALLILALLCYLWKCCFLFDSFNRRKEKNQVSGTEQTINFLNKGVQANNRIDTRSSIESTQPKRRWKFYRQRDSEPRRQPVLFFSKNLSPVQGRITTNEEIPAFIYRANLEDISPLEQRSDLFVQDIAETEYRILDPGKLNVQKLNDQSGMEIRKFMNTRRSGDEDRQDVTPANREETYVREGNAEILRLRSKEEKIFHQNDLRHKEHQNSSEKISARIPKVYQFSDDKEVENFSGTSIPGSSEITDGRQQANLFASVTKETESKEGDSLHQKFSTSVIEQIESKEEKQPNKFFNTFPQENTQEEKSLTNYFTDTVQLENFSTYFPTHDDGRKKREIEDLVQNVSTDAAMTDRRTEQQITEEKKTSNNFAETEHHEKEVPKSDQHAESLHCVTIDKSKTTVLQNEKPPNEILLTKNVSKHINSRETDISRKSVADPIAESTLLPSVSVQDCKSISNLMNISHLEKERNRLASFQRDLLLTRFLVEEQRRFLNQTSDTVSLPGSLSMGTQTDRHQATQTDVLCMMRPEPRKVKSENDDSSDSDIDCLSSTHRISRRTICIIGKDGSRHKIRTPIIEESESTEMLRHTSTIPLQRENKSSTLRLNNNRNKIKEVLVNGKIEKYDRVILRHSKHHKSTTDISDFKTDQKKVHSLLRDAKKSMSYSNINDANILTEKEVYTPRSLKSRMIARRLSASEQHTAHYTGNKQQETKEKQKVDAKNSFASESSNKIEEQQKRDYRQKLRHQKSVNGEKENVHPEAKGTNRGNFIKVGDDENGDIEENSVQSVGMGTLKLKGKNQQLMEKKSVFTIAYDDATTEHLGESSNGSTHD